MTCQLQAFTKHKTYKLVNHIDIQGGPKKVSHYQVGIPSLNRIKNRQ